jgi:hypothetical protein
MARKSARERRIEQEIIVDCYGPDEQAIGWYYYLEGRLNVPFTASCTTKRAVSPLKLGEEVEVIGMPPESECEREMFVTIRWDKEGLAVPLAQLRPLKADRATRQAVEDWLYWVERGYTF